MRDGLGVPRGARVTGTSGCGVDDARRAFDWFLGQNQKQLALYDPTTGGCRDGLHADRVNENQGAESTLSFLLALAEMRATDRVLATGASFAPCSGGASGDQVVSETA